MLEWRSSFSAVFIIFMSARLGSSRRSFRAVTMISLTISRSRGGVSGSATSFTRSAIAPSTVSSFMRYFMGPEPSSAARVRVRMWLHPELVVRSIRSQRSPSANDASSLGDGLSSLGGHEQSGVLGAHRGVVPVDGHCIPLTHHAWRRRFGSVPRVSRTRLHGYESAILACESMMVVPRTPALVSRHDSVGVRAGWGPRAVGPIRCRTGGRQDRS